MSIIPSSRRSGVFDPFSLDAWDPLETFNSSFIRGLAPFSDFAAPVFNTKVDWKETADAHIFTADLPGLKKEEVKIEVEDGNILQISGERRKEEEQKNDKYYRVERSHGKFLRRFRLPENAKVDEAKAAMDSGVLTVTVPKQPESKTVSKSIPICA